MDALVQNLCGLQISYIWSTSFKYVKLYRQLTFHWKSLSPLICVHHISKRQWSIEMLERQICCESQLIDLIWRQRCQDMLPLKFVKEASGKDRKVWITAFVLNFPSLFKFELLHLWLKHRQEGMLVGIYAFKKDKSHFKELRPLQHLIRDWKWPSSWPANWL